MAKSKNKLRILVAVVVVLAGAGAVFRFLSTKSEHRQLSFAGNVDIRDVSLAFRAAGRVDRVLKNEGDRVVAGEVIATLEKTPFELALAQARATAEVAQAELESIEAGARREDITQARAMVAEKNAVLERARDNYVRTERLQAKGAATAQSLVDARTALEQSRAAVSASQALVDKLVHGARSEELRIAHARAAQAQTAVAIAELNLADTELRAKTGGVVVTRVIDPGAMVQAGSPAFVVAFEDPVWIRAYAPETALPLLAPGTEVRVYHDGRPDRPYSGRVGYVSPQAEFTPKNVETAELRSSLVYRFRVVITEHDGGLRQGMPVTVRWGAADEAK